MTPQTPQEKDRENEIVGRLVRKEYPTTQIWDDVSFVLEALEMERYKRAKTEEATLAAEKRAEEANSMCIDYLETVRKMHRERDSLLVDYKNAYASGCELSALVAAKDEALKESLECFKLDEPRGPGSRRMIKICSEAIALKASAALARLKAEHLREAAKIVRESFTGKPLKDIAVTISDKLLASAAEAEKEGDA